MSESKMRSSDILRRDHETPKSFFGFPLYVSSVRSSGILIDDRVLRVRGAI